MSETQANTRYDYAARRRVTRKGRERGCSVYIPAEVLLAAGFDADKPPPVSYKTWPGDGSVLVRLYREL